MIKSKFRCQVLVLFFLIFPCVIYSQIPQLINYQGLLTDPATGDKLNGTYSMTFSIYSTETGGTALWTETQDVTVQNGLFSVLLGSVKPLPMNLFDDTNRYLGVKVGTDAEMTPRKHLVSVGYAFNAYQSDKLDGKDATDFVETGQENAISTNMIQDNAVTTAKIAPAVLSSIDGVSNDGGNVDLVAGSNVTITPDDENNRITISATGGTVGDNLGNHTATQNIKLNGHWLSGDGGNEGVFVKNNGNVGIGTNNPINVLHIKSPGPWVRFEDSDGGHLWLMGAYGGHYFSLEEVVGSQGYNRLVVKEGGNVGIKNSNPVYTLDVNGTLRTNGFRMTPNAGAGKVLTSDASGNGTWQTAPGGDNLGNHTATQNIKLNGHWLSGDGGNEGVFVTNNGKVGIGTSNPSKKLEVNGAISGFGIVPVGSIIAWHKSFPNTPPLPEGWVECNGQRILDTESPYYNLYVPNLNGEGRFLRGSNTSGVNQSDQIRAHDHVTHAAGPINGQFYLSNDNDAYSWGQGSHNFGAISHPDTDFRTGMTGGDETRPINMSVVWIMRIK